MAVLKKIKINEISAVRKPAQEHARVKIMKMDRGAETADEELETVRKLASDGLLADFEKHQFVDLIHLRADDIRRDGESIEKAFTRCIESDPCGRELYTLMKRARGTEVKPVDAVQDDVPKFDGPASRKLDELTRDRQRTSGRSYAQSYSDVIDDPKNRKYRDAANGERELALIRTLDIFDAQALTPTKPFPREARGN